MKKQMLLVLSLLLLPVFANAQVFGFWLPSDKWDPSMHPAWQYGAAHSDDPWVQDFKAWCHNLEAAVRKKIDEFLGSDYMQGIKRFSRVYSKVSSESYLRWKERIDPPFSIQNIPVPERGTLGGFIYDKTETALEGFTENHAMVYSWFRKTHIDARFPDTPKEAIRNYAQNRAYIETSRLLKDLRSNPFDIHPAVTDELSRGALEYKLCILESGGLEACEETYRAKYGERKLQEFKNILEVREKWVYYMEKNPIFKYYVLNRNFADLQSLNQQEYETLIAFFSGAELTEGWQYFLGSAPNVMVNVDGYLIRDPDGFSVTSVSINPIYVKISDQLVAEISPEILQISIYRQDLTTNFYRSLNWKNSKDLQLMWDFINSFSRRAIKNSLSFIENGNQQD